MYTVEVKAIGGFTQHSTHDSYRDAVDQADMVRGRVICDVPDGVYFLHPEGSSWIAVEFDGGQMIDRTEESNADTHSAANDSWAGVVPSDDDSEVDGDIAAAIIAAVMGDDTESDMVVVTKR
jgi:hypothetical protein